MPVGGDLPSYDVSRSAAPLRLVTRIDILNLIVQNVAIGDILQVIAMLVEREIPGSRASILLLDDDDTRLHVGAGPSLPLEFHHAVEGEKIGPRAGSCGTAAYDKRVVITTDIRTDPAWENWRPAAEAAGLAACWSTPFLGLQDRVLGTFAVYFDVSRRPTEAELAMLHDAGHFAAVAVQHDTTRRLLDDRRRVHPLTRIANRSALVDHLAQVQKESALSGRHFSLVQISLEGLASINEWLGPSVGDQALRVVAARFSDVIGDAGLAAHMWGRDFVVLAESATNYDEAVALAERLLEAASQPLEIDGMTLQLTASVGVLVCHEDADSPRTPDELLRNVTVAQQSAKSRQGRRIVTYDAVTDPGAEVTRLAPALQHGMEREELTLNYQPIVELATGAVEKYEALLRWASPLGDVSPSSFVPVAERTGLVSDLGRYALRRALAELHRQRTQGRMVGMSVNLSARQLSDDGITTLLADLIAEYELPPGTVTMEVTEGVLLAADAGWRALATMRELGARIALDDFGTGFTQISYLRRFEFDEIKIDQTFVRDLHSNRIGRAIVVGAIAFARAADIDVVAEGIERRDQADTLLEMGCTHGQGHLFGEARPLLTGT